MSNRELTTLILSVLVLLTSATITGRLFEKLKLPKVIGEITGGMLVGGSGLALILPNLFNQLFYGFAEQQKILNIFYQLGLIFLMFSSGYSTDIKLEKKNIKNYALLFTGATIIPMVLGIPFVGLFRDSFISTQGIETEGSSLAFLFVFLISVSITSIPVISKIFFDIGMMNTKFSDMILTVSTLQDLVLWIMLNSAIVLIQTGKFEIQSFLITTILTIGIIAGAYILKYIIKLKGMSIKSNNILSVSLITTFLIIFILNKLNINIMYSSFISGYLMRAFVNSDDKASENEIIKLKDVAMNFFVPIYFALVGLQLDIIHNFNIGRFVLFFIIAFGIEFIGTVILTWFTNFKRITVISLGITMNARGGPGIVLATTAYSAGIINLEFFTVLIITTMISSALAGCWLRVNKQKLISDI